MKSKIIHFPKRVSSSNLVKDELPVGENNVIRVDFIQASKLAKEQAELIRMRNAFDLARADWQLEEAEFPELNRLYFKY